MLSWSLFHREVRALLMRFRSKFLHLLPFCRESLRARERERERKKERERESKRERGGRERERESKRERERERGEGERGEGGLRMKKEFCFPPTVGASD